MISTTTTLASSANPSTYGSSVSFTATITPQQSGGPTMTGTVAFYDGSVLLGSTMVMWDSSTSTGGATLSLASLLGGSHSLTAAYSGDGNYGQSRSAALAQTVNKATPSVAGSSGGGVYGQAVTLTGGVTGVSGALAPTGSVTFTSGSTNLGTVSLPPEPAGTTTALANLTVSTLPVGTDAVSVSYSGDGNYTSGTPGSFNVSISKANTNTALTSSVNPAVLCQAVTLTATVTAASPGAGTPTGSVGFYQSGTLVATVNLTNGVATYQPTLSQGTTGFTANYGGDSNFNTSGNSLSQVVNAAVNWVLNAAAAAPDPLQAVLYPFGPASVSPAVGALQVFVAIDPNQHPGCGCGCSCGCPGGNDNCRAGVGPVGLAFATRTLNVQPVFLVTLASDFCAAVPSQIQVQLTWNGNAQGWLTFGTSGHTSGDVYALPVQVSSAVTSSGIYTWQVEVKATVGSTIYDRTASGVLPLLVNTSSPYGAGWSLAGTQALLIGTQGIAIVDNATGGYRYFTGTGPSYTSPANDQGTLAKNGDGTYTYTSKEQLQTHFSSSGVMSSQVDPHGLTQALAYSSGLLSTITQPDGGVTSFTYNASNLLTSVAEPGGRFLTMSYDSNNNLTGIVDAAGGVYTLAYDTAHRLVNEQVGPLNTTYTYSTSNGMLTEVNRGLGTTLSLTAAAAQGLGASTAINASQQVAALTDALSHTTSLTLDALGRQTQVQTADGAVQNWTLDAAGNPTRYADQLGRQTAYTYNSSEDLTQVQYPDGTSTTYQYELTFHQVTQIQDARGNRTTMSYDSTTSDLLTVQDALGNTTTHTWSNGLKQTTTDALNRVTTLQWDSTRRRQTALIDALNNVTSFGYDSAGNQNVIEDALARLTTLTYDGNRRPLTRTNALNGVFSYTYDAVGNTLTAVDELARTTSNVYDQRGLQVSRMEAVGTAQQRATTTTYDAAANVLFVTDPLTDVTSYAYDVLNRPVAMLEAYGTSVQRATTAVYDLVGNVLSGIDARAIATSFGYDVRNRQIQMIEAYGTALQRTTTTAYDPVGNVLSSTNPRGTVTSYDYDADNRPTQRVDAYGTSLQRTTTTSYDKVGNVLFTTNPVNATTSYAYDALNRQTQVIEAYGSSVQRATTTSYDPVGNVLFVTNPRSYTTSYAYDALNRRVLELDAYGTGLQRALTTVYDAVSNMLSVANGLNVLTSFAYDSLNRRTAELDAYGTALQRTLTTMYDLDDKVTASIDALGYRTTYGYDSLNRCTTVQDAGGGIATTVYDPDNNVVNMIDQLGHKTTYVYDSLNRRTQTIDSLGGTVTLSYDANDNLVALTDPVNNQTQWQYDALDRKIQETDPLSNSTTYAHDTADRLTSSTDRNGQRIAYSYDLLNRETGETWYNSSGSQVNALTFTCDPNNNLLAAANNAATNTMSYDALDRLSSVQVPFGAVLTNSYDLADNRTVVQDSFAGTTTRTYDALNRMTTIRFGGVGQTPLREDMTYTARDQVNSQARYSDLAGSTEIGSSVFTYNSVARLTNLQHEDGTGANIANYTNTYDLASRITAEVLNGGTPTSYSYDTTNQLTNDSVVTYTYDLNGNRTMTGYATGPANEMTSDGTWNYFYDKNGNVIGKANSNTGETWAFGYDNRNRLTSSQQVTSGVQMQATYVYDPQGQRIEKDVWSQSSGTTTTTRFAYDAKEIWADLSSGNALQTRYLRGMRVLELLARITTGGTAAWLLADRMETVRNVTDNTGTVIDTITYDGYGNVTTETNPMSGGQYKHDGYRYDSETGLYRPDATVGRYYIPRNGIWLGRDPLQFRAGDANLYRYLANGPTLSTDPFGLLNPAECARILREELASCQRLYLAGVAHAGEVTPPPGSLEAAYLAKQLERYLEDRKICEAAARAKYQRCINPQAGGGAGGIVGQGGLGCPPGVRLPPAHEIPIPIPPPPGTPVGAIRRQPPPAPAKPPQERPPLPNLREVRKLWESLGWSSSGPSGAMAGIVPLTITAETAPPVAAVVVEGVLISLAFLLLLEIELRLAEEKDGTNNQCKPCISPVATKAYRLDVVPPAKPHPPFPGDHVHLYDMHQSPYPVCKCFWHRLKVVAPPPPAGYVPITPAGGGGPA
jgi:RHS repeat-associated protein